MSAFMPMRGRKDGRDQLAAANANLQIYEDLLAPFISSGSNNNGPLIRENEDDSSILHLIRANGNGFEDGRRSQAQLAISTPAPRQFANQFAYRHNQLAGPIMDQGSLEQLAPMDPQEQQQQFQFEPFMQAKLRRAFHPMRGKRAEFAAYQAGLGADEA